MKPVLQILHSPDPGGVLALAEEIAAAVEPHGYRVETLFITARPGMSSIAKLRGAWTAARRILSQQHDAVIAYQAWPSIVVGLAGAFTRRPRLIVHQTTVPSATWAPIRWLSGLLGTLGLYPVNIVNTLFTQAEFDGYPRRYRQHLKLIEHGVEVPRPRRSRAEALARHGVPDNGTILLNTARLVEEKNQATLIRCLPDLPHCRLVVAGDGVMRDALPALARELGVEDRVHLLGALPRSEAIELYGAADLFLFPSMHETFGISAVEAALLGLPTIVGDIPVLREVLTIDGRSPAAFVAPTDVAGWTKCLSAWSKAPPLKGELERFGHALGQRYSEQRMINAYLELLAD